MRVLRCGQDVRRLQGTQWRFQYFYSLFRDSMSSELGLGSAGMLSMYSPLQTVRRLLSPQARRHRNITTV